MNTEIYDSQNYLRTIEAMYPASFVKISTAADFSPEALDDGVEKMKELNSGKDFVGPYTLIVGDGFQYDVGKIMQYERFRNINIVMLPNAIMQPDAWALAGSMFVFYSPGAGL